MSLTPVSVCIPTFNGESFVAETINSVLAQTLGEFEVIICDDASRDRTVQIAESYKSRGVRVIAHEVNVGAVANWNRAISSARFPLVKLLHQDDRLDPSCLEEQVSAFQQHSAQGHRVALVASQRRVIGPQGEVLLRSRGLEGLEGAVEQVDVVRRVLVRGTNVIGEPSAVLMSRHALEAAGPFGGGWQYLVDLEYWIRLLAHGHLVAMPVPLVDFRVAPRSWSAELASEQYQEAVRFLRHLARSYPNEVPRSGRLQGIVRARASTWARRLLYMFLEVREKFGLAGTRDRLRRRNQHDRP